MSTVIDIYVPKEVSCRFTNSVLKYLEYRGFNIAPIFEGLPYPYTREYLSDTLHWVTREISATICRRAAELTQDDAVMVKVGLSVPTLGSLGGFESAIRKLTGPKMLYRFVPKYARLFDRDFTFKTTITGKNTATIEMRTVEPLYKLSRDFCYYAQGILSAVPTLWGLPPAEIHERECMCKPVPGTAEEGIQYGAESHVYEVKWQPLPSWYQRLRDSILGRINIIPDITSFKELEQSLRHIDQKNTELIARNSQLAAVREIAMGVDKVKTIDEALTSVVEQAREIEGILFVLVQKLDDSGKFVVTPYYSKIHNKYRYMVNAIKALGFDPEKELGKSPTSNKFRIPLSKLKIAQDILKDPRIMVFSSLNEMLDGVWPRFLCESIQKIMGVKKFVLVPLIVEGKYWGSILYFLTRDVPLDILEMIGTHCELTLYNIINTSNLISRNTELTARNKQLAAVREIALGVDKVRTIDEALVLTIEQSREIDGIRFVLVQKMDEKRENVITPYYSKIRADTKILVNSLKAIGFDPEKELGKSPTSNKLRFPLAKLKVAQEYNKNPRVMAFNRLAELLDGVWPKTLCDAIQKIGGFKKFVIVPLLVEGESWGHILYFLSQDVPRDILEMIGGHCALAIKNIINLDSLVSRNIELTARNSQLAIVREITVAVDKVQTIDEALRVVVDQAREIEGVRFVLVQKLDESREFVITPYYSRVRPQFQFMVDAVKALGFDLEKELGKNPTSNKLRFRFSKLKVAQEYVRNPRVMVFPSLAGLLEGIWPRTLCNGIQKIMGAKKLVIVPIMVEGESWGNLLFFLTRDVPLDILEMIGAHCGLAVKNINYIEALATEAVRKRILIDESLDGIVILDDKAAIVEANQRFAEMLGYSPEEVRKLHTWDWDIDWKPERILEMARTVGSGSEGLHLETQHRRKDGSIFDVDITVNGAVCEGQKLIFCVCRDVTGRRKTEEALKESEERFNKAFRASPTMMAVHSLEEGRFIDVNAAYTQVTGYERSEVVGKTSLELNMWVYPGKRKEFYGKLRAEGRVKDFEVLLRTKSGEIRMLLFSAEKIMLRGTNCLVISALDITERQKAEEALQKEQAFLSNVIASIQDSMTVLDDKLNIMSANRTAENQFARAMPLIGKKCYQAYHNRSEPCETCPTVQTLKTGKVSNAVIPVYGTDGTTTRWAELHAFPMFDTQTGEIIGVIEYGRDITKRVAMERALKESEEKFSKAFRTMPDQVTIARMKDNVFVDVNDSFCRYNGYTREEVIGRRREELDLLIGPRQRGLLAEIVKERGRFENIELEVRDKTGETRTLLFSADIINIGGEPCQLTIANDISERKRIEQALKESEDKFSRVFRSSPDAVSLITVEGERYIDINDSYTKMTGYSREELIGNTAYSINLWVNDENHARMHKMMQERGRIYDQEFEYRTKSGEIRTRLFSLEPITINGEPCTIGVSTDITERKRMVEALQESEERYRTIFESANDVLILIDSKGKIIDVNDRIKDIGGYDREELIGKNIRSLSSIMTKKSLLIVVGNFLKRMAGLEVPFYDVEMIKKNGEHLTIQINAMAVRKEGKIIGDLAILRDITEIKQAEKSLKLQKDLIDRILATIPNAVLLLNKDLNVIIANQTFYNLFKYKKNQVESRNIRELIKSPELDQAITKVLGSREKNTITEFRYSIGSYEKMLLINVFAMEEEHLLLVVNDVTEEREKQERLYLTDRLVSVGEMAAGVAHEINNPLTSVIGLSSFLAKQDVPDGVKEDLQAIYSEAQRCASIVKSLLTFARKHVSRKEPINVAKIIDDVLKLRAYEHKVNNIAVKTAFPPDLPEVVADYFEIQQVFINIILNAEAAMIESHGRGTLKIAGRAVNSHVAISFTDDGPGISKENMRFIFNPFFTTKEVGKGTGLGLSICYGIVASHGGKIHVKSELGKGATFVVELPTQSKLKG